MRLTPRHHQIIRLVGRGLTNQEIATDLGVMLRTIKNLMTDIMRRAGVRNRTELAVLSVTGRLPVE